MYLLDTNIISEIRKINRGRANQGVVDWATSVDAVLMYISCISLLEIESGILSLERKDIRQGQLYRDWFESTVKPQFHNKVLPIDGEISLICARMHVPDKKNLADSLIAATAIKHNLTLVTRNIKDFEYTGVRLLNPFV
ncbi:twitching motility protein PilT [Neisseria arctica]|uniref:Twitching motility protein PilT n=1 Tax=Neisseria arctica TaxID=1470200 RepID=A0A0J0YU08_9NEIS|nr:type II toxin-antitoxin system VapC family toxin [Neisseria arctica]KLT73599.1 twitching motility protein PilT [Neisseria arctica]UOO85721.1 type II toxin-antitoxin system VapC family toxin [Neisseria arctica]